MSRTSSEWEEPHPGQRYSYTLVANSRPSAGNYIHGCNGGSKVGVAAKAYAPYPSRERSASQGRRLARPRLRAPRSLKNPNHPQDAGASRPPHSTTSAGPMVPRPRLQPHTQAVCPVYGCCCSSRRFEDSHATSESAWSSSEWLSSPQLAMTDFSGYLNTGLITPPAAAVLHGSDPSASYMSLDHHGTEAVPAPHPSPSQDPYGWNAGLERKIPRAAVVPRARDGCWPVELQCRRAEGTKRTLLQRMLSLAPKEMRAGMV